MPVVFPQEHPERSCCLPEARTYKSIVLLSLIICLRKGYAFEHLEQFHLHALLRRALRKVRGVNSSRSLDRLPPVQTTSWNYPYKRDYN